MDFLKAIETELESHHFTYNSEMNRYEKEKYRIEFGEKYKVIIKYKSKAKKNTMESIEVWVVVFSGLVKSATTLEVIISSVCYER